MNISAIGSELANLETKIKDEATLSQGRKQTFLQNIELCRTTFRAAAQDIDNALSKLGEDMGGHFDEHIVAINELIGEQPLPSEQKEAA